MSCQVFDNHASSPLGHIAVGGSRNTSCEELESAQVINCILEMQPASSGPMQGFLA